MSPFREELFFIRAEDIGHFEPVRSHFRGNCIVGPHQIERAQHFRRTSGRANGNVGDMKIACRSLQVRVAEQCLYDRQPGPVVQQMRCKSVAERMRMHRLGDARQPRL